MGFDSEAHERYIEFIQQKHALPLANDGCRCFNRRSILASALVLDACRRSVRGRGAVYIMRFGQRVIGFAPCWLVWRGLRLLFRDQSPGAAAGLLVAAFLPPNLYMSQYVTNEPLGWSAGDRGLYLCLRLCGRNGKVSGYRSARVALGGHAGQGFPVLLALPCFPAALSLQSAARKQLAPATGSARWAPSSSAA